MLVGQRKKSQKYFDLSTFNYNLYDSNLCSSLGVMNFQKWELFSGSPGRLLFYSFWDHIGKKAKNIATSLKSGARARVVT